MTHRFARRLVTSLVVAAGAGLALVPASAGAAAPQVGVATSNATTGMTYVGTDANNRVKVTRVGTTFTVDDVVAIKAGTGCSPVAGDTTKVTCVAFKNSIGAFIPFQARPGLGDDVVANATAAGDGRAVGMFALGGAGNDTLFGTDGARDELRGNGDNDVLRGLGGADILNGSSGNDLLEGGDDVDKLDGGPSNDRLDGGADGDTLDGGSGADRIDGGIDGSGGFFSQDTVSYDGVAPVSVDLRRTDASQGTASEGDTILRVENVRGGAGDDLLIGNPDNNTLQGFGGNDTLLGEQGRDLLLGDEGNDFLFPSPGAGIFPTVFADGVRDILECGNDDDLQDVDFAFQVLSDGDLTNKCEQVIGIP